MADRGSEQARAFSKGLKEKQYSDFKRNLVMVSMFFVGAVAGLIVGGLTQSFWWGLLVGAAVFFGAAFWVQSWYYRE
jgi:F0F1-type ATP synthase assembly protein I